MGLLRNPRTGRSVALGARVLVGRAGTATLRIESRMVSNEHAAIWWENGRWMVRDVGSRNGTKLDGAKLEPGERVTLHRDATLCFGHDEHTWTLVDAGAPVALARAENGAVVEAEGGVLCLPAPDDPRVMIFEGPDGRWVAETAEGSTTVRDGAPIAAAGHGWILHLPQQDSETWAPKDIPLTLGTISLRFRVSQDEEYIEASVVHSGGEVRLQTRAHFELMLTLGRARMEDHSHPPPEQGWRYTDAVQKMLGLEPNVLNLHIFRARQQLGEVGVVGAAGVFERRPSTGQLRLGVDRVEVLPLAGDRAGA